MSSIACPNLLMFIVCVYSHDCECMFNGSVYGSFLMSIIITKLCCTKLYISVHF